MTDLQAQDIARRILDAIAPRRTYRGRRAPKRSPKLSVLQDDAELTPWRSRS